MKFEVYTEKETFEEIILNNNQTTNWYSVCNGSDTQILLNLTDENLEEELIPGTPIFEFVKASGGRKPVALASYFIEIQGQISRIVEKTWAAFHLKISQEKALLLQREFGVVVQPSNEIKDILDGSFGKYISKGERIVDQFGNKGWKMLLSSVPLPPLNAIVLSDPYVLDEDSGETGILNLTQILDVLLPDELGDEFHLLIITDPKWKQNQTLSKRRAAELKQAIDGLNRPFKILTEIVFSETIHKRLAISNYFIFTSDIGFNVFKRDQKTPKKDTDILLDRIFSRYDSNLGDSPFKISIKRLQELNKKCQAPNAVFYGACQGYESIKNRLLVDFRKR